MCKSDSLTPIMMHSISELCSFCFFFKGLNSSSISLSKTSVNVAEKVLQLVLVEHGIPGETAILSPSIFVVSLTGRAREDSTNFLVFHSHRLEVLKMIKYRVPPALPVANPRNNADYHSPCTILHLLDG